MSAPATINLRVQQGGRIIIPAWARKQLDMRIGTSVVLNVQADHATLISPRAARHRACRRVRRYLRGKASLSAELMAQRKRDARRE